VRLHRRCRRPRPRAGAGARREQKPGRDQVGVGHTQRIAEEQLLEPLGALRDECEQRSEAHEPGYGHGRAGVRADALVASGEGEQRGGDDRAARRAEQERRAGDRREHEPWEQPVRERLSAVGEPFGHDPEPKRAGERADQRDLEQRAPADAGLDGLQEEVEYLHLSDRRARGGGR
jgi:hypothetical protein